MIKFLEWGIILLNGVAFVLMGYDKRMAQLNKWRVREWLLLLLAVLGGSAGVWFGMKLFHHKTRHQSFAYGVPIIVAGQVLALLYFSLR